MEPMALSSSSSIPAMDVPVHCLSFGYRVMVETLGGNVHRKVWQLRVGGEEPTHLSAPPLTTGDSEHMILQ